MRPVLIDSDVLIEVLRARDSSLVERWGELSRSAVPVCYSPVSVAELWHGARPREFASLEALFSEIQCVPIDHGIGQRAGDFLRDYSKSHALQLADALIAATVMVQNLSLWTRNRRHYPMRDIVFF